MKKVFALPLFLADFWKNNHFQHWNFYREKLICKLFTQVIHSSEIRGLCFKICHILYIRKPKVVFSIFHFMQLRPGHSLGEKTTLGCCSKFWSISLGHFIKHKPLFSEEWLYKLNNVTKGLITAGLARHMARYTSM